MTTSEPASSVLLVQGYKPTIDVLNALELQASAVGNHEFEKGYGDFMAADHAADWDYLGANVYAKGTTTPVLDEYRIITLNGVKVAIIGAVTQEAPTLVTPSGVSMLEFGYSVEVVNRVAEEITDQKLADVIVAEFHGQAGNPGWRNWRKRSPPGARSGTS